MFSQLGGAVAADIGILLVHAVRLGETVNEQTEIAVLVHTLNHVLSLFAAGELEIDHLADAQLFGLLGRSENDRLTALLVFDIDLDTEFHIEPPKIL